MIVAPHAFGIKLGIKRSIFALTAIPIRDDLSTFDRARTVRFGMDMWTRSVRSIHVGEVDSGERVEYRRTIIRKAGSHSTMDELGRVWCR